MNAHVRLCRILKKTVILANIIIATTWNANNKMCMLKYM